MTHTHLDPDPARDLVTTNYEPGKGHAHDAAPALVRNRFFPRKLMEVRHWQTEQDYHRGSRQLVTRLGLGKGVLCGLEVHPTERDTLVITPGVAVDGLGRLVVVRDPIEVDPTQLTDGCGRPTGDAAEQEVKTVTVSLCYHDCGFDIVRMPPDSCCPEAVGVPSLIREVYAVTVTQGVVVAEGLPDEVCHAVFDHDSEEHEGDPDPGDGSSTTAGRERRRVLLDHLNPRTCTPSPVCVPLATIDLVAEPPAVDTTVRTVIRSNRELLDLILCLAERVEECCRHTPTALAPRVTDAWPRPNAEEDSRATILGTGVELAFDRDIHELGLDNPSDWVGLWLLDADGAIRFPLVRVPAPGHATVPVGGDGASYRVDVTRLDTDLTAVEPDPVKRKRLIARLRRPGRGSAVVLLARSGPGGPIRATESAGALGLDADLIGSGLDPQQQEELWTIGDYGQHHDLTVSFTAGSVVTAAVTGAPSTLPLPSGDGAAGGALHVVYPAPGEVLPAPRLERVWPEGADDLSVTGNKADLGDFLNDPRLVITVSRALSAGALAAVHDWFRAWHARVEGDFFTQLQEMELGAVVAEEPDDGPARYTFPIKNVAWADRELVVAQLRATATASASAPVGREDPALLVDADFVGTELSVLDPATGSMKPLDPFDLWAVGVQSGDLLTAKLTSTRGRVLWQGTEGGVAHWGFTVVQP